MTEIIKTEAGIPYYDEQMGQTKQEITDLIRLLLRQTFLLERKYDKKQAGSSIQRSIAAAVSTWNLSAGILPSPTLRFWKTAIWG